MVQIPKGLKTYMLESIPNFQNRLNCRKNHFDWKTSWSLLRTDKCFSLGIREEKNSSAVERVDAQPLLQSSSNLTLIRCTIVQNPSGGGQVDTVLYSFSKE